MAPTTVSSIQKQVHRRDAVPRVRSAPPAAMKGALKVSTPQGPALSTLTLSPCVSASLLLAGRGGIPGIVGNCCVPRLRVSNSCPPGTPAGRFVGVVGSAPRVPPFAAAAVAVSFELLRMTSAAACALPVSLPRATRVGSALRW